MQYKLFVRPNNCTIENFNRICNAMNKIAANADEVFFIQQVAVTEECKNEYLALKTPLKCISNNRNDRMQAMICGMLAML